MYEAYSLEFEAGPYWWLTSALTIEPPLPVLQAQTVAMFRFP